MPWYAAGVAAILCAIALTLLAVLGPLGLGVIQYHSSQSAIWQIAGNDLANLVLTIPLLIVGAVLDLLRRPAAKYFLVLTPVSVFYYALSIGIGQEWSDPTILGNSEQYFWPFLLLMICSLVLLLGTLPRFVPADAPDFDRRKLRLFVVVTALFLAMFTLMWASQVLQVERTGDLADGSYVSAPTVFWTIRYLDLGLTVPIGFLSLGLLMTRPRRAYGLVLLFFGFFINTGTAVNSMAAVMFLHNDPSASVPMALIFLVLGAMSYALLCFMVKDKVRSWRSSMAYADIIADRQA